MSSPVLESTTTLYEQDFYAWTQQQAELLRAGRLSELDTAHLLEEIESMGISERRELYSRIKVLLHHLLKWSYQPAARSSSWANTIDEQRDMLELLLQQSPSLRRLVPEAIDYSYPKARRAAARETGLAENTFPDLCPYQPEQILADDFWPGSEVESR